MTQKQLADFLSKVDADNVGAQADLPDLIRFLFGTGVRFGAALAARWRDVNLAEEPATIDGQILPPRPVCINGDIVYESEAGLVRHDGKSAKSNRVLELPGYTCTRCCSCASLRWPMRRTSVPVLLARVAVAVLGAAQFAAVPQAHRLPDVHHACRPEDGRYLDHHKQSARQIAGQLGHANPSMAQNVYMGREMASPDASATLDRAHCTRQR